MLCQTCYNVFYVDSWRQVTTVPHREQCLKPSAVKLDRVEQVRQEVRNRINMDDLFNCLNKTTSADFRLGFSCQKRK